MKKFLFPRLCLLIIALLFFSTTFASTRYILDTDMGFDDWMAVEYLLEQKNLDVAAITVDCQGETRCPEGAVNASRLTHLAKRDVPIAMGNARPFSQYDFPKTIRDYATAMNIPGFRHLKTDADISKISAAQMILTIVTSAAKKHQHVVIISIGSATNINDAWQLAKKDHQEKLFRDGLKMIVKGGGAFGDIDQGKITNHHIDGNIAIPGMVQSNNRDAEWNIYVNAIAMHNLVSAGLPITFVPNNASDQVHMTKSVYLTLLQKGDATSPRRFVANAMLSLIQLQGGWKKPSNELDFWDEAATIAAVHPSIVAVKYTRVPVTVITTPGDRYATLWVSHTEGKPVTVDYHLDKQKFYQTLYAELK